MNQRILHIHFWLFIALTLLIQIPVSLNANNKGDVIIPFELINGLIILDVEVDGVEGAFLLDTGADAVLINGTPDCTDQVMSTVGGAIQTGSKQLNILRIGAFVQHKVDAQVINMAHLEANLGIELHGILGGYIFMPRALTLDFANLQITISAKLKNRKGLEGLTKVKFDLIHDIPVVDVKIGDKIYKFALDSGASIHFIDEKLLEELSNITMLASSSNVFSANHTSLNNNKYVLDQITIGDITFDHHQCISQNLDEVNSTLYKPISGILSLSLLTLEKVIFDFKKKNIYF